MPTVTEPKRLPVRTNRLIRISAMLAAVAFVGCGETQVSPENREIILRLATATSVQESAKLDTVTAEIDRLKASASLSAEEEAVFLEIIAKARSGDWESARRQAYSLRDGQKPTSADLEAVSNRTLPEMIRVTGSKNRKPSGG